MKLKTYMILTAMYFLTAGCGKENVKHPDDRLINIQLIKAYNDMALENAIITQHTLYPYHFVQNGAELNELGKRDFGILIKHFAKEKGHLNVRRSEIAAELYSARVEVVYQTLKNAGLNIDKIKISDDMPGGTGMPSENVIVILEKKETASISQTQDKN